jgi:hypothetical protein
MLAMVVNDDVGCLNARSAWTSIASKLGSYRFCGVRNFCGQHPPTVGASLLAMDANDDAGCLNARGVWTSIASKLAPTDSVACATFVDNTHPL